MANEINIPYFGMQLGKNPKDLKPEEYSLMVNGNIESFDTSPIKVTNESSNILCSSLKPNFQITGILPLNPLKRVYYFIHNPLSDSSEIVYINNAYYQNTDDEEVNCTDCNSQTKESTPLEQKEQSAICKFNTFVSDPCLQFNIKEPISATYRINERGLVIFFAQPNKPLRYIEEYDIPYTLIPQDAPSGCTSCTAPEYTNQLDCNRIKIIKDYQDPCINISDVIEGGNLKAGVYQFLVAYSDERQQEITDFSNYSLPVSIHSRKVTVNTDYETNKAIKLEISNLLQEFERFTLVVVETLNNISTSYIVGNFPISSNTFLYTYTGNNRPSEIQIDVNTLRKKRPIYTSAELVTQNNDFLFWAKLKEQRPINLQPVVNNLRIKAATIETFEGFYSNPLSYDSVSYLRDEVYPFFIYFKKTNGYQTADFLISNHDENYYISKGININKTVSGANVISTKGCDDISPNKYWQVFSATPPGVTNLCGFLPAESKEVLKKLTITCQTQEWGQGDPEPSPCSSPDPSYNPEGCTIETVSPSGVISYAEYSLTGDKNVKAPLPISDKKEEQFITNDTFFKGSNSFQPEYINKANALSVTSGIGNSCSTDSSGDSFNTTGEGTVRYLRTYFSTNVSENWFELTITNPVATAIQIKMYTGSCTISVEKQNGTPITHYDTTSIAENDYFLIINNLNSIEQGDTVYIKVTYSGGYPLEAWNYSSGQDSPTGTPWYNYGNVCIYNPAPINTNIRQKPVPERFVKVCSFSKTVSVESIKDITCFKRAAQEFDFAYWQSSLCYPNNPEVWGDLCGKPIRYHKFPSLDIAPIQDNVVTSLKDGFNYKKRIYPIGIKLDIEDVKGILNQAVQQGLLTEEEKLQITSFGIKRGNRRQNKSIIARGLLYDMWKAPILNEYKNAINPPDSSINYEYYPNYPYNDIRRDPFILSAKFGNPSGIAHPFDNSTDQSHNNRFTFYSPETSYNNPNIGTELVLEYLSIGAANVTLSQVEDHAKYVLLTQLAVDVSEALASGRIVLEASFAAFSAGSFSFTVLGTGSDLAIVTFAIYLAIGLAAGFTTNLDKYTIEQANIFKNLLNPKNYCYYYHSVGNYSRCVNVTKNEITPFRFNIYNSAYLQPNNITLNERTEVIKINNFRRDSSVYLSLGNSDSPSYIPKPSFVDTSRVLLNYLNQTSYQPISSYYTSIKNYVPDQYGLPEQIELIDTGYCGRIDWSSNQFNDCEIIFGGDTYIGRHSFKRKFPYFLQERVNFPEDTDVNFQEIGNVAYPKYWFNSTNSYLTPITRPKDFARRATASNLQKNETEEKLENPGGLTPGSFIKLGKMYLYQFGIPYYITESSYNLDLRHGEDFFAKNYYPNILDVEEWTQPTKVPFDTDNTYFYNTTYSKQLTENLFYYLKPFYNQAEENTKINRINRVHYSKQYNPLSYSANDYFDFDLSDGELTAIKGIEQYAVLVTQTNASKVFNAFIEIPATPQNIQVTTGNIFAQKPRQYYKTDLGFGGATHQQIVSTPYGHFYVDSENPAIIQLQSNNQKDITQDTENKKVKSWFRENLPFQIQKQFPEVEIDNPLNNLGISLGWDNKYHRLFITKLDYKLKPEYVQQTTYSDQTFYYKNNPIKIGDPNYFYNKSWTLSYSPKADQFISFYTFTPNSYVSHETYFQTIYNNPISVQNHLQNNQSYQVFNGSIHPFIIDYTTKNTYVNKQLANVSYLAEFRRYQDNLNYYLVQNKTFNKALVYTDNQSSGYLKLTPKQKNNQFQNFQYLSDKLSYSAPFTYSEILVDNNLNLYTFNKFQDRVNNKDFILNNQLETQFTTQPILYYTPNNPAWKELNPSSLSYTPTPYIKTLQNEYFSVRLINDIYSNYNIQLQFNITNTTNIL